MKKKIMIAALAATLMMSLVACSGNVDAPVNATIDSTPAIEESTQDEIETPVEDGIVESGTLDIDTPSGEEIEVQESELEQYGTMYDYTKAFSYVFETNCEATDFVDPFVKDNTMARHYVSYKNEYGDLMEFTFDGPTDLQGAWTLTGRTLIIASDDETYRMSMWNYGVMSDESELMRNLDEETIIGWSSADFVEGTFQVENTDDLYRVIFEVTGTYNDIPYRGYNCYIDYIDRLECYQFMYLVEESTYDKTDALAVVKSIAYYPFDEVDATIIED